MDRANIMKLTVFLVFLVWHPGTNSQWVPRPLAPRPLCVSQFALATHACALLPIVSSPPPSTPPPSPNVLNEPDELAESDRTDNHWRNRGQGNKHDGHGHDHGRKHRRHRHRATPVEEDCCRWLGAIDSECVCDLLVYLPLFLSKPYHQYTVLVHESCNVTFQCGSRIRA